MKSKIVIIALISITGLVSSCKKYLNEQPIGVITSENFYQNATDALAALTPVYSALRNEATRLDFFVLSELPADDVTLPSATTATSDNSSLELLNYSASNSYLSTIWGDSYLAIARANNFLGRIDSSVVTPALCRRMYGEARFLRALHYFRLVRSFGDVPLLTQDVTSDGANLYPGRTSTAAVYQQIINDLKYAEINLDVTYPYGSVNFGRATQGAAKALLGKVYLTMAGNPVKDQSKLTLAQAKLKEVIDNKALYGYDMITTLVPVATTTPYADIFDPLKKGNNKEYIFSIRAVNALSASGFINLNNQGVFFTSRTYIPTTEIVNQYSAADKRMTGAVNFKRKTSTGTVESTTAFSPSGTNPIVIGKFYDANISGTAPNTVSDPRTDFPLLRYTDVVMMYAETLVEQNINLDEAKDLINAVRLRAGISAITYTSQDDLRQKLRTERRLEFAFEGHRWYDLVRWGLLVPQMRQHGTNIGNPQITSNVSEKNLLFPIPASELSANGNLTQNPGY